MNKTSMVNMFEAKTNLSKLVARVQAGETITLAKNGMPVVDLSIHKPQKKHIKFGTLAGKVHAKDEDLMGVDPEIMEMFFGKAWNKQ